MWGPLLVLFFLVSSPAWSDPAQQAQYNQANGELTGLMAKNKYEAANRKFSKIDELTAAGFPVELEVFENGANAAELAGQIGTAIDRYKAALLAPPKSAPSGTSDEDKAKYLQEKKVFLTHQIFRLESTYGSTSGKLPIETEKQTETREHYLAARAEATEKAVPFESLPPRTLEPADGLPFDPTEKKVIINAQEQFIEDGILPEWLPVGKYFIKSPDGTTQEVIISPTRTH